MSIVDRLSDACLRGAAGRWPDADGMLREWRAELAFLGRDRSLRGARRRIGFAASLALSAPDSPVRYWPRRAGAITQRATGHLALAAAVTMVVPSVALAIAFALPGIPRPIAGVLGEVLVVAAMVWIGARSVRSAPAPSASPWRFAIATVVPIALAMVVALFLLGLPPQPRYSVMDGGFAEATGTGSMIAGHGAIAWLMVGLWAVVLTPAVALAARCRHVLARVGWLVAGSAVGLEVATVIAAYVPVAGSPVLGDAVRAFPASLVPFGAENLPLGAATYVCFSLLLCAAFLVPAVVRYAPDEAARRAATARFAADVDAPRPVPVAGPGVRVVAMVAGALGILVWAGLAAQRPALVQGDAWTTSMPADVSAAAMVLVLVALVPLLAGRGPVAPGVLTVGATLGVVAALVSGHGWHGPAVVVGMAVVVALAVAAAWAMTPRMAGPSTSEASGRRALVLAAVTAPLAVVTDALAGSMAPHGTLAGAYAVAVGLATVAVANVLAARRIPAPMVGAALWATMLAVFLYAVPYAHVHRWYAVAPDLAPQLVAAVAVACFARWNGRWRTRPVLVMAAVLVLASFASMPIRDVTESVLLTPDNSLITAVWTHSFVVPPQNLVLILAGLAVAASAMSRPRPDTDGALAPVDTPEPRPLPQG